MLSEKIIQRVLIVSVVLSLVLLLLYALLGFHARMVADDFCTAYGGLVQSPLDGAIGMYNSWAGQYVNFFIKLALAPLQPAIHSWLASITIGAWLLAFAYLSYQILTYLKLPVKPLHIAIVSIVLTYTLHRILPANQHVFWFAAVIPYTWSAILMTIWFTSIFHYFAKSRSTLIFIGFIVWSCLAILIMGGLIETTITLVIALLGLLVIGVVNFPSQRRREYLFFLFMSGLSAVIALAIALLSPGSWARRQLGAVTEGINLTPIEALWDGSLFTLAFTFGEPLGITFGQTYSIAFLASLFLMGFVAGLFYFDRHPDYVLPAPKNLTLAFGLSFFAGIYLIFSVIYPITYAARGFLPIRPLILPRLIQLFIILFWLYLALASAQRHHLLNKLRKAKTWSVVLIFLSVLFIWGPATSIYKLITLYPDYQAYAISWDERHEYLSNLDADGTVYVPPLSYDIEDDFALEKMESDTEHWINRCVATYYGLDALAVEDVEE